MAEATLLCASQPQRIARAQDSGSGCPLIARVAERQP